jgi:hypothetical protein
MGLGQRAASLAYRACHTEQRFYERSAACQRAIALARCELRKHIPRSSRVRRIAQISGRYAVLSFEAVVKVRNVVEAALIRDGRDRCVDGMLK